MIRVNSVLASVLERAGETSGVGMAIRAVWSQRSKEGELLDAFDRLEDQAKRSSVEFYRELQEAIQFKNETTTLDDLVVDSEWWDSLDESVKQMQAHSNCGADCLALIIRADLLIDDMADVADMDFRTSLIRDVARQCEVFVNG